MRKEEKQMQLCFRFTEKGFIVDGQNEEFSEEFHLLFLKETRWWKLFKEKNMFHIWYCL